MNSTEMIELIKNDFKECQVALQAIGDETRQAIITTIIEIGCPNGVRVGEIAKKTHLSRAAVSHHLKILKDAGIVSVTKVGTKNYYLFESIENLNLIKSLILDIEKVLRLRNI